MLGRFGYLGANFGKREQKSTPAQMAAEKYYTPEEFKQVMADLSAGLITVRIYEDGIVIDRKGRFLQPALADGKTGGRVLRPDKLDGPLGSTRP